jgi:prepilin peptidase CpaA
LKKKDRHGMAQIDLAHAGHYLLYGGLIIILVIASITDLSQRRIPNLLTLPAIVAALLAYCLLGGLEGFLFSLRGLGLGFAVFLIPYFMGGMGAGDVKLMAAVGAVLGFSHTLTAFLFIAVCGGVIALGMMAARRTVKQTLSKIFVSFIYLGAHKDASLLKVDKSKPAPDGIPYAVAIAGGVFLFFIYMLINQEPLPVFA